MPSLRNICILLQIGMEFSSFTSVDISDRFTDPTFHFATPDEFTITPFNSSDDLSVIATPTAQEITAIWSSRCSVTFSSRRSYDTNFPVSTTVIGWSLHVNELIWCNDFTSYTSVFPTKSYLFLGSDDNLNAFTISTLSEITDLLEARHRLPTGLQWTRSWNTMTSTKSLHSRLDQLLEIRKRKKNVFY